jgi:hypothetical protein
MLRLVRLQWEALAPSPAEAQGDPALDESIEASHRISPDRDPGS